MSVRAASFLSRGDVLAPRLAFREGAHSEAGLGWCRGRLWKRECRASLGTEKGWRPVSGKLSSGVQPAGAEALGGEKGRLSHASPSLVRPCTLEAALSSAREGVPFFIHRLSPDSRQGHWAGSEVGGTGHTVQGPCRSHEGQIGPAGAMLIPCQRGCSGRRRAR